MVAGTLGALFVGGIVAILFSGVVTSQAFSYFKTSPDLLAVKALAVFIWLLDFFHSIWITIALWDHLIAHFGDTNRIDYIPWSLAITIAFTAILTFLVHLFFVYRIYRLSHGNIYVCLPLALMACARLCFACLTTAKMIQLRSLTRFVELYTFSFTTGLSLSAALDIFITCSMIFLLSQSQKKANSHLTHVLDKLMLYTFENGSLTCAATLASLICWLTNKSNLVFMGLHFVISKLYANSFFATLNARNNIQQRGHRSTQSNSGERNHAVMFPDNFNPTRKPSFNFLSRSDAGNSSSMQIKVDKTSTKTVSDEILMGRVSESSKEKDIKSEIMLD